MFLLVFFGACIVSCSRLDHLECISVSFLFSFFDSVSLSSRRVILCLHVFLFWSVLALFIFIAVVVVVILVVVL